jgi:hypothetical protein
VTAAAVPTNVAELEPLATVTDPCTVRLVLLLAKLTTTPPEGAAELIETVQLVEPAPVTVVGVHDSVLN